MDGWMSVWVSASALWLLLFFSFSIPLGIKKRFVWLINAVRHECKWSKEHICMLCLIIYEQGSLMNKDTCEGLLCSPCMHHSYTHFHWRTQTHHVMWPGVFNQTFSSPLSACSAMCRDAGHCRFTLVLLGYVAVLAEVQMFWLGYGITLKLTLSPWLYDSSPWRQKNGSDLITHTAAIPGLNWGLGGMNEAWGATYEEEREQLRKIVQRGVTVEKEEKNQERQEEQALMLTKERLTKGIICASSSSSSLPSSSAASNCSTNGPLLPWIWAMVLLFCSMRLNDKWWDVEEVNNSSRVGSDRSEERYLA